MFVLFFDIDGTLLYSGGSGLEALRRAFSEVFDVPPPDSIPTAGRTDRGIARDLFRGRQVADSDENWLRFRAAYVQHLREQLPLRKGWVLPGVVSLLEELATRRNVALGLLTGNTAEGAWLKLQHFGLDHHFAFGGYGDRSPERNAVAEDALAAAHRALNGGVRPDRTWVIGDTPMDIQCARHIGARALAVATGMHAKADLAEAQPDLLLDDLRQADAFLQQLDEVTAA